MLPEKVIIELSAVVTGKLVEARSLVDEVIISVELEIVAAADDDSLPSVDDKISVEDILAAVVVGMLVAVVEVGMVVELITDVVLV